MSTFPAFAARPLDPSGKDEALQLAAAVGMHGIYVANAVTAGHGEAVGLWGREQMVGCLWFGPRGNLIVMERQPLDPDRVADSVQNCYWPWRIALGPTAAIDRLAGRLSGTPLVHRDQVYHGCAPAQVVLPPAAVQVRRAERADRDRLIHAALQLNHADLNVDPKRVDRRWLRSMVDSRIRDGSSWVLGPPGEFHSKLDLGSEGPAGLVLEGVYTFPEARGRGCARALVAAVAAASRGPCVCLHVAAANMPARRAYDAAGLREDGRCRLLLAS